MIEFHCENCGQKFSVPQTNAGKKGRCPKCKNIVVVPKVEDRLSTTSQSDSGDVKVSSENSPYDLALLDIPQKGKASAQPSGQYDISDGAFKDVPETEKRPVTDEAEPADKRKLPWIIDIFLYPASIPGLTSLGIIIVLPLLINITAGLLGPFGFFISIPGFFFVKIPIVLYLFWYLAECVRDSAFGGIRAPETLGNAPGLGDMFWHTLKIVGCYVVFIGPPGFYFLYTHKIDAIFWALLAYAFCFFPMGLLAIVMFDSFSALNPILLIGSILSTFFQYCGMVLFFCVFGVLVAIIKWILLRSGILLESQIFLYVSEAVDIYLLMIWAHLLGGFYWRYEEKLNWDV